VAFERDKVKGAVRTDFILSAEIIVIALGTVAHAPFTQQVAVLVGIALIMTAGVYGLVGGIVKLDDLGLWLSGRASGAARALGRGLLALAPRLMKFLSVAGTAAMFLVGGGILVHGIAPLHHAIEAAGAAVAQGALGGLWRVLATSVLNAAAGMLAGALVLGAVHLAQRLRKR
jgi:predicted DNA repair protein MutK